MFTSVILW